MPFGDLRRKGDERRTRAATPVCEMFQRGGFASREEERLPIDEEATPRVEKLRLRIEHHARAAKRPVAATGTEDDVRLGSRQVLADEALHVAPRPADAPQVLLREAQHAGGNPSRGARRRQAGVA